VIGLNIVVAFAIDMFGAIQRLDAAQVEHEKKLWEISKDVKRTRSTNRGTYAAPPLNDSNVSSPTRSEAGRKSVFIVHKKKVAGQDRATVEINPAEE
jgi:hypothetical protein